MINGAVGGKRIVTETEVLEENIPFYQGKARQDKEDILPRSPSD
jgi:hypothetical protein